MDKAKLSVSQMIRTMPTALDLWIMLTVVLSAFGKPIPWVVWVIVALEAFAVFKIIVAGGEEKQDGRL